METILNDQTIKKQHANMALAILPTKPNQAANQQQLRKDAQVQPHKRRDARLERTLH